MLSIVVVPRHAVMVKEGDQLQLFHFDNQAATCSDLGDHRRLPGENEIEPGF